MNLESFVAAMTKSLFADETQGKIAFHALLSLTYLTGEDDARVERGEGRMGGSDGPGHERPMGVYRKQEQATRPSAKEHFAWMRFLSPRRSQRRHLSLVRWIHVN